MEITVAICTWNRAELLGMTLSSFTELRDIDSLDWEVLVVNNNSTDETDAVIAGFRDRLPIRSVLEKQQGLSNARNRAVIEANGSYIIWTDDDVRVTENWLKSYVDGFHRHPEGVVFGGIIRPLFLGHPPEWLVKGWEEVASAYAVRDLGKREMKLDHERVPYGANYAMKRSVQRRYEYDTNLGRMGGRLLGGEETAVIRQILDHGLEGWWIPEAMVFHLIDEGRQNIQYIRRYYYNIGIGGSSTIPVSTTLWSWVVRFRKIFPLLWNALKLEAMGFLYRLRDKHRCRMVAVRDASWCWGEFVQSVREITKGTK